MIKYLALARIAPRRAWVLWPWWRGLMPRALWVSVISQSLLIKLSRHCANQSSLKGLRSSGVRRATTTLATR